MGRRLDYDAASRRRQRLSGARDDRDARRAAKDADRAARDDPATAKQIAYIRALSADIGRPEPLVWSRSAASAAIKQLLQQQAFYRSK